MRTLASAFVTSSLNGVRGASSVIGIAGMKPVMASRNSARSSTSRAMGPEMPSMAKAVGAGPPPQRPGEGRKPDDAAIGGRRPQRSGKVGALAQPDFAGRERDGRAARRPAGVLARVPGVARVAEDLVEGVAAGAELGRVGLADDNAAAPLHHLDQRVVFLRHEILQRDTAEGRAHAGDERSDP